MKTTQPQFHNLRTIPSKLQTCKPNKLKGENLSVKPKRQNKRRQANQEFSIPKGVYIPPKSDPEPKSSSSDIGASAKAHAAKARPSTPRQPPDPPPPPRKQEEKGKSQHQDESRGWYDKGKSHQQPFHPGKGERNKGKGKGSKYGKGYGKGYQSSYKGKGYGSQSSGGWEWYNQWT